MDFPTTLRVYRATRRVSAKALAQTLGIPQTQLATIERGKAPVDRAFVLTFAEKTKVPVEWLDALMLTPVEFKGSTLDEQRLFAARLLSFFNPRYEVPE